MIVGVGIDLEHVARFERASQRFGAKFAERLFTAGERAYCAGRGRPAQHMAARFAAKEALLKALGEPRAPGLEWTQLEVVSDAGGAPRLVLSGAAAALAAKKGVVRLHLSLTHTDEVAGAVVVLESAG